MSDPEHASWSRIGAPGNNNLHYVPTHHSRNQLHKKVKLFLLRLFIITGTCKFDYVVAPPPTTTYSSGMYVSHPFPNIIWKRLKYVLASNHLATEPAYLYQDDLIFYRHTRWICAKGLLSQLLFASWEEAASPGGSQIVYQLCLGNFTIFNVTGRFIYLAYSIQWQGNVYMLVKMQSWQPRLLVHSAWCLCVYPWCTAGDNLALHPLTSGTWLIENHQM